MSPRTGRPTSNPKTHQVGYRLSDDDVRKLHECTDILKISASEVIRRGIDKVYSELPNIGDPEQKKGSEKHEEKKTK